MFSKSRTPADKPAVKTAAAPSLINRGLTVTGDLHSDGEIQVDGEVIGDIDCNQLVIGETGTVRGEIIAEAVSIRGEVNGRVRGSDVSLSGTAKVIGDILHRSLAMEAGAHLEGQVRKVDDPRAPLPTSMPKLLQTGSDGADRDSRVKES